MMFKRPKDDKTKVKEDETKNDDGDIDLGRAVQTCELSVGLFAIRRKLSLNHLMVVVVGTQLTHAKSIFFLFFPLP